MKNITMMIASRKFIFLIYIGSTTLLRKASSIISGSLPHNLQNNNNSASNSDSDNVFTLGEPTMFGSGCPAESVGIISSTDGQTVTVLFSEYTATTSDTDLNDRVACNLAIPVSMIQGFAVGVFSVDYRGFAVVPNDEGSYAEFTAEYFFAGNAGPQTKKMYTDYVGDVDLTDEIKTGAIVYSDCGSSTIFRINTAIRARKAFPNSDNVVIQVDSTDTTVVQSFRYHMTSKPCI